MMSEPQEVPLPPYIYGREAGPNEKVWTEMAVREMRLEIVRAERERWISEKHRIMQEWHDLLMVARSEKSAPAAEATGAKAA